MTLTILILLKLMLTGRHTVKNSYTEFYENLANSLVTETSSQTYG